MKILIVDDSSVDRHFLKNLLEGLGHEVEAVENTRGILDKLSGHEYNIVFLDVVMPEQDGFKFLREIRANPSTKEQYVVLYSSKGTPLEVNYGLKRTGANEYLVKPATKDKLETLLATV